MPLQETPVPLQGPSETVIRKGPAETGIRKGPGDADIDGPGEAEGAHERDRIEKALFRCRAGVSQAAETLGISRQTLHRKIRKYKIDRKRILAQIEMKAIEEALAAESGNITRAAARLSVSRQLLAYKIKKYDIPRHRY